MKFMNNHYGQSQIFGRRVRFNEAPSGDGSNGIGDGATAGGTSNTDGDGGNDNNNDNGDEDPAIALEALKIQLAKERAEKERFKSSVDSLTKKNKDLTAEVRKNMTDEQKAQEDRENRDKELAELKREVRITKYSKRLVGFGMSETEADEMAGIIPELEDADAFFDTLGKFIENVKKTSGESAVQKLLKERPDINAGNGESDVDDPAMALAKDAAKRTQKSGVNDEIINKFR